MKNIILTILLLCPLLGTAQKVEEKSHKSKPAWVNGAEMGYLVVSAEASDIESAKTMILGQLKAQVAGSVASRVLSESTIRTRETSINDAQRQRSEEYESYITTKAANIPFINEISLSKASDYYWEKIYDKKSKSSIYHYHVKYPFSDLELKRMVEAFLAHEAELDARIKQYADDLNTIPSVEFIDKTLNELRAFLQEFTKDDPRYAQVEQLSNNYRRAYKNIIVEEVSNKPGEVSVRLVLNRRNITTSQQARISSNCADQFNPVYQGDLLVVKFNDFNCYEDDSNYIDIRFKFGNDFVSKKIYFKKN